MTIKELRTSKKLTQVQMARLIGVNQSCIGHLENGRMRISDRIADKVWEVFGVEVRDGGEKKLVNGRKEESAISPGCPRKDANLSE